MRDRLIELFKQAEEQQCLNAVCSDIDSLIDLPRGAEFIADYLLANGVIVPPCKVGDTVYCVRYDKARKPFVKPLPVRSVTIWEKGKFTLFTSREDYLGKTVFLTREEAERALKGGVKE